MENVWQDIKKMKIDIKLINPFSTNADIISLFSYIYKIIIMSLDNDIEADSP